MPGGAIDLAQQGTDDVNRIESPVTLKAYLMCAFAAFGGIFFGYDSGYINGVLGMGYFHRHYGSGDSIAANVTSLIVSILSAGTFRTTVIAACVIFLAGVGMQTASEGWKLLVAGRAIAGLGVGGVSCTIILYMSEIAPRKIRGALVAGYQFCITIGLLLASALCYATQDRNDSGSYRIPVGIQAVWAIVLAVGLAFLPESPRYYVRKGNLEKANANLARLRNQPVDSEYVKDELAEIVANHELEQKSMPSGGYLSTWFSCFRGSVFKPSSNLRRTILGTSLQMMQQLTGVNFVFYFGTSFFQNINTATNPFLISLVTTLVNVFSTPVSFWTIERFGRRPLLIWGAVGMVICQFLVAIIGVSTGDSVAATKAMIALLCIYIFFFASTWGPGAWVVIGEIFPLPIRARGVALSTASNWLWNCVSTKDCPVILKCSQTNDQKIIAVIAPYMYGKDKGNLGPKVFFIWGSLCSACFVYSYFLVYETKGLSLEQYVYPMSGSKYRTC
jgi:sugar porter (SP) family MFS transporter